MNNKKIHVAKPFLPPKHKLEKYMEGIWERNLLTNNGPLIRELEEKLGKYIGHDKIIIVNSGTMGLQISIKALNITKGIITTPFSYVATTSSIVWEGCEPQFVDIDSKTLNINVNKIENVINDNTEAIMATHCFGNPCDIDAIRKLALKYNLKVIYDSAHCFGTQYKGQSIFNYGDISVLSLHATKLYHMVEGGVIFLNKSDLKNKVNRIRNFGHDGPENFTGIGINGKNSEIHAAFGLINLEYADEIIERRLNQALFYDKTLEDQSITRPQITNGTTKYNFAYYPVIFEDEETLLKIKNILKSNNISTRRYFFPTLNKLDYIKGSNNTPVADKISKRILCLPLYHSLKIEEQKMIADILINNL